PVKFSTGKSTPTAAAAPPIVSPSSIRYGTSLAPPPRTRRALKVPGRPSRYHGRSAGRPSDHSSSWFGSPPKGRRRVVAGAPAPAGEAPPVRADQAPQVQVDGPAPQRPVAEQNRVRRPFFRPEPKPLLDGAGRQVEYPLNPEQEPGRVTGVGGALVALAR